MPQTCSSTITPKNWPPHLPYLRNPSYSPTLTAAHLTHLHTKPPPDSHPIYILPAHAPKGPCPLVKITPITNPTHPAHTQAGLFASRALAPGSFILEYLGVIHSSPPPSRLPTTTTLPADPHAQSDYDLSLCRCAVDDGDGGATLAIDAARQGNEARFINDYRGVAGRANAEFRELWSESRGERGMGVWVVGAAGKGKSIGIRKGEEIVVSYGRGFWRFRREERAMLEKEGEEEGLEAN